MTAHSPIGREGEHDPATYASLCGKLDAVEQLKIQVDEMREEQKERAKEVSCRFTSGLHELSFIGPECILCCR